MQHGSITGAFTMQPAQCCVSPRHRFGAAIKIFGWDPELGEDHWVVVNSWNDQGDHV